MANGCRGWRNEICRNGQPDDGWLLPAILKAARLEYETKSAILADIAPDEDIKSLVDSAPAVPANDEEGEILPPEPKHQAVYIGHSGYFEWFTPINVLEAARDALGGIDIDPASCAIANENVQAVNFMTIDDNVLDIECRWKGRRVWLNPPYDQVRSFVGKLVSEYEHPAGGTTAAILLTSDCTDTSWFQLAASRASCICFTFRRLGFLRAGCDTGESGMRGSAIFYFGPDRERFKHAFAGIGYFVRLETAR